MSPAGSWSRSPTRECGSNMPAGEGGALRSDARARIGMALLALVAALALLAPVVSPIHPDAQRDVVATRFLTPMSHDVHGVFHPLGTDRLGRDVWAVTVTLRAAAPVV